MRYGRVMHNARIRRVRFRVRVSGFGIRVSGFRVLGFGSGFGFRVSGLVRRKGKVGWFIAARGGVQGSGFRVQGSGSRAQVSRFRGGVQSIPVRQSCEGGACADFDVGPLQGYLAHKKAHPPQDHHRALGTALL